MVFEALLTVCKNEYRYPYEVQLIEYDANEKFVGETVHNFATLEDASKFMRDLFHKKDKVNTKNQGEDENVKD